MLLILKKRLPDLPVHHAQTAAGVNRNAVGFNRDAARHVATRPLRQNRANSMPFSKVYVKNIPIVALTRELGGCRGGYGRNGNLAKVVYAGQLSSVLSPS